MNTVQSLNKKKVRLSVYIETLVFHSSVMPCKFQLFGISFLAVSQLIMCEIHEIQAHSCDSSITKCKCNSFSPKAHELFTIKRRFCTGNPKVEKNLPDKNKSFFMNQSIEFF